jgi:hypothetical protein
MNTAQIEISGYEQLRTNTDFVVQIVHKPDFSLRHTLMGNMERLWRSLGLFTGLFCPLFSQLAHILCGAMVLLSNAASTAKEWSFHISLHH